MDDIIKAFDRQEEYTEKSVFVLPAWVFDNPEYLDMAHDAARRVCRNPLGYEIIKNVHIKVGSWENVRFTEPLRDVVIRSRHTHPLNPGHEKKGRRR